MGTAPVTRDFKFLRARKITRVLLAKLLIHQIFSVTGKVLMGSIFFTLKKEYSEIQSGGTGRDEL
jgi:hypothetical protein